MALTKANNYLAVHIHQLLSQDKKNVFFSPFSISVAMGMLLCASDGETAEELRAALGHDHAGIKKQDVASLMEQEMSFLIQHKDSYTLSIANSMLCQEGFNLKAEYKKVISDSFKGLTLEVDFHGNIENVKKQINDWVKEKTKNMIPDFVKTLSSDTVAVLLNAVYFKGSWKKQFDKENTKSKKFYNNGRVNEAKKVDMMHLTGTFPLFTGCTYRALQLPYVGDEMAMLVLLPHETNGLKSLEATLSPSFIQDIKKSILETKVDIAFPRFKLDYEKSLINCFQKLGVKRAFGNAQLPYLTEGGGLSVTEILHRAVLDVNEEGSEAAATTMVVLGRSACRPRSIPQFIVDHPFLLVIYNIKTDLILFMARVNEL